MDNLNDVEIEEPTITDDSLNDVPNDVPNDDIVDTPPTDSPQEPTDVPSEEVPAFTPNLKYKAYGEEKEFDEWAHGLINEENNEHFTKLYEKAGGFDHLKNSFKELETSKKDIESNFQALDNLRIGLMEDVNKKDFRTLFNKLEVKEEDLFNYIEERVRYHQMDAGERQRIDQAYQLQEQNRQLQMQQESTQEAFKQQFVDFHNMQMNAEVSKPEINSVINQFNASRGNDNAFMDVVNMIGTQHHMTTGQYLAPSESVKQAVAMLGLQAQPQQVTPQVQEPVAATPAPQPVPTVGGGAGGQVVKKKVKSMDDIQKEIAMLEAQL